MNGFPKTGYISQHPAWLADMHIKYNSLMCPIVPTLWMARREFFAYPNPGYVVPMEKKPNRFPNKLHSFRIHHHNFLAENNLQIGYGYFIANNFPRKCLPMVGYLHQLNLIVGYDIDDDGFVTYNKEEALAA